MKTNNWRRQLVNFEIMMPIIMMIFVVVFIVDVYDLPKIAKRTPSLVGLITLVLLLIQTSISIAQNLKDNEKKEKNATEASLKKNKVLYLLLIMLLYNAAIYFFGFLSSTIVMMVITMRAIGEKSLVRISLVSGMFLIVFYFVFVKFFRLKPPEGVLW
ncbi:MAG: tripartite tricarboxylate transporter TctB family protein [Deltaproteobacteria bacterium]|nr:tripartite tricarboxylate transporter TctB family protein [Deltaproteobacteria bacterium]